MPKKKTVGPDTPAVSIPAAARRRTSPTSRKVAAVRPDPGVAEPGATPAAQSLDTAADLSVGASSSDGAAAREPSYDEIATTAYHRYLDRGGRDGRDLDDWLEAERSLRRGK
jgi:hypothetical protein